MTNRINISLLYTCFKPTFCYSRTMNSNLFSNYSQKINKWKLNLSEKQYDDVTE